MRRAATTLAALAFLTACGGAEDESLPTAEESQGLNEAAAMLDEAPDALNNTTGAEIKTEAPADTGDVLVADTNGQ